MPFVWREGDETYTTGLLDKDADFEEFEGRDRLLTESLKPEFLNAFPLMGVHSFPHRWLGDNLGHGASRTGFSYRAGALYTCFSIVIDYNACSPVTPGEYSLLRIGSGAIRP